MTRLSRPLVCMLGFSVFCACTTTRAVDLSSIEPGGKVGGLVWVTTHEDGSGILLRDAYLTETSVVGRDKTGELKELPLTAVSSVSRQSAGPAVTVLKIAYPVALATGITLLLIECRGSCSFPNW